ncbi:hypothetical protein ABH920_005026 [Catenulispora sp. EB89]|uniref:lantibiotic dehydratase n=1 Tax=Catenulispora sp. EB89 TaxID=3156257 RepID=UPI003516810A
MTGAQNTGAHRVPLGDTGWSVWREVLLRTTGFPADGLDRFGAAPAAAAADALLAGPASDAALRAGLDRELAAAAAAESAQIAGIVADPLFREALAWQNSSMQACLDSLASGRPTKRRILRRRERAIARYWQRYCAKNETIGFFGPVCWGSIDADEAAVVRADAGPALVRDRKIFFEHWALDAYAQTLVADPEIRAFLPPALLSHFTLDGDTVLRPAQPPLALLPAEAELVRRCTGAPAATVVASLVEDSVLRRAEDGSAMLGRLVERGVLTWDADLPIGPGCETVLAGRIAAIADDAARARALAGFQRLQDARDKVAAAAGEAEAVRSALEFLAAEFVALTGRDATRSAGQTYAGRTLCVEDTVRDLDVVVGRRLLDDVAAPLEPLLLAARWLSAELARTHSEALRALFDDLAEAEPGKPVNLADLWFLAQGLWYGSGPRPVDAVAADFARRWSALFGLDDSSPGESGPAEVAKDQADITLSATEVTARAVELFPAENPGWSAGRLHSPDLQICAPSLEALNHGDYLVVLGELHVAWATFDCSALTVCHPRPEDLAAALAADLGEHRVRLLYPTDWPRTTSRLMDSLDGPTDRRLGIAAAPGADREHLLPVTSVTVADVGGELLASAPDGRTWPLLEIFSTLLATHAVDGFKTTAAGNTPRITVDRLVVARRTWRTTVGRTGLAEASGETDQYLAARAWRAALALPDRAFVKVGTEVKPFYVDLTSPTLVSMLCQTIRRAQEVAGPEVSVTVSEMLPGTDQAWVPDRAGRRYFSELRLHITDPEPAPPSGAQRSEDRDAGHR